MKNALLEKPHCRLSNCIGRYSRLSDGSFRCERCDDHVNGDFRPMTDPKLQMARRIADRLAKGEAIDGFADLRHKRRMEGALAAIEECTERAAATVKEYAAEAQDAYHRQLGMNAADALIYGDHLKGPTA